MAYNLKHEEEVKEFIENLGTEYRFGCFYEKKPDVCHLLGDYLEAISGDFKKALTIFKNNCDLNNFPHSCYKTGTYYMQGKTAKTYDDNKALEYLDKGCKLGFHQSCHVAGTLSMKSERVRDYTKGLAYYEKACKSNIPDSCYELSILYIDGDPQKNIPKDMKKAAEYSSKACDLQNMYACANLSRMYKLGDGVQQNELLSKKYKSIALELQDQVKRKEEIPFQVGIDN